MKLVIFFVSAFLSTTTTTRRPTTTTTTKPTTTTQYPTTTGGSGVNLKGKMFTLSQDAGVTFFPPYYPQDPPTTTLSTTTTTTTTAPVTRGVSVCLRFLEDSSLTDLFTLAPDSFYALSFSLNKQWFTLSWSYFSQVSLSPRIMIWASARTQPWTSVCVVLDSLKNVVQVFQGGAMSIRKIPRPRMSWSGQPVVEVSAFDGQLTDLEVWDFPLENTEIFRFMQNYGSSGSALTWSNITYTPSDNVLIEDTYAFRRGRPISSSEGEEQPIRSGQGRDQRHRLKKRKRQRKRQMF